MELACPKCASTEVRRLALIYNEGLSIINAQTVGAGSGMGSGGVGFGTHSAHTVGRQQTALSKMAAPPDKKHWVMWSVLAVPFGLGGLSGLSSPGMATLLALGIAGAAVWFAIKGRRYNRDEHPSLMQRWEQSFMCNRCGDTFVPG